MAVDDRALRPELRAIAGEHKRWAYVAPHHELCLGGWEINRKRTPAPGARGGPARSASGAQAPPAARSADRRALRVSGPDEVWAIDFQHDMTADGRALRLVNVVDQFTREALIMGVGRSISADETVTERQSLVARHGRAQRPELSARCVTGVGSPRPRRRSSSPARRGKNPFVESFHARMHNELLNTEQFACLPEARVVINNTRRAHSALGTCTPAAFAAELTDAPAA